MAIVIRENMCALLLGILSSVLLTLLWIMKKRTLESSLPPGPLGVPFLGYLPWLDPVQPYKSLNQVVSRYGPVFSVQLGSVPCVVLANNNIIREMFSKAEVAGRPPLYLFSWVMENSGIIFSEARAVTNSSMPDQIKGSLQKKKKVLHLSRGGQRGFITNKHCEASSW